MKYFVITLLAIGIIILWQIVIRLLANKGIFFVRVPEMTALAITKDRALYVIYVVCSNHVWDELTDCMPKDVNGKLLHNTKLIRLKGKSLKYIGRFWVYKVYEWYYTKQDEDNTDVKPLHSLSLAVLNIEYEPEDKDPQNGTPNLKTGDGVEAKAKLVAYIVIRDPEKALFNVDHIKTFIRGQIMAEWREVLAQFQFFQYIASGAEEKASVKEENREILLRGAMEKLNNALRESIGTTPFDEGKNICEIAQSSEKVERILFNGGGIVLLDITLEEFQAADPEVEQALEELLKGKAAAQRLIQEATGRKEAKILDGQGEAEFTILVANALERAGKRGEFLRALQTIERATENIGKATNLTIVSLNEILGPIAKYLKSGLGSEG